MNDPLDCTHERMMAPAETPTRPKRMGDDLQERLIKLGLRGVRRGDPIACRLGKETRWVPLRQRKGLDPWLLTTVDFRFRGNWSTSSC